MQKVLEIIAGPNGSGKTTFAEKGLEKRKESLYFNSDNFTKAMTLNGSKYAQFEAGRMLLTKVNDCLVENRSFSNFIKLYAPLADKWHVIDNSDKGVEIASMKNGKIKISEEKTFNKFFK